MSAFDSASLLAARASSSDEGAIIRMSQKTRDLRAQGRDIVSLTLGEPDFDTPALYPGGSDRRDARGLHALFAGRRHSGIAQRRRAQAQGREWARLYCANQIVMANGVKQAIANAVLSLIEPGDEVILLAPFWVSYELIVKLAGGTPRILSAGVERGLQGLRRSRLPTR